MKSREATFVASLLLAWSRPIEAADTVQFNASTSIGISPHNPLGGVRPGASTTPTVHILDSDSGLAFEYPRYWVQEDEASVQIAVIRSDGGDYPVQVDVTTVDGTARSGVDYIGVTNTLTVPPHEKIRLLTIPILNDDVRKAGRLFRVVLSNPSESAALGSTVITTVMILDNDPGLQFIPSQIWVREQEGAVVLTVARGNDRRMDAGTVDYATVAGTAVAGVDYTDTRGTLRFDKGETICSFQTEILDRGVSTPDRQFTVILTNATGALNFGIGRSARATVTICDNREMRSHRLDAVRNPADGAVSITLGGGYTPGLSVSNRLEPYFDIYPIEVSTNLQDWTPWRWLIRTNALPEPISFQAPQLPGPAQRFYRTPTECFIVPQRPPSGPYPIGFTDRVIEDEARRNRYRISTNGSFPITIWYPAARQRSLWPSDPYEAEVILRDWRESAWNGLVDRSTQLHRYGVRHAPFAENLGSVPVILWSHGYLDERNDGQEWVEDLASHGYVVVAVDHADSGSVVYPDGRYLYTGLSDTFGRERGPALLQDRVRDLALTLDALRRWNEGDELFAGRLDPQNAAVMGWSYGGGTAAEFARLDSRVKAAVVLEGYFQDAETLLDAGLEKPVLSMYQGGSNDVDLFNKLKRDAVLFQIRFTEHDSFYTWYWAKTSTSLERGRETARTITDYSRWFLNTHLKGGAEPMPDPKGYPQVFNFKQK